jgi:hypothetical protein
MAGSTWTNPDQVVFLNKQLLPFVEAQDAKTLTAFWNTIWHDFFLQWPTPESELVPNGLEPLWDGSQKSSRKRKKSHTATEGATPEVMVNPSDTDKSKWVGLRREVSAQFIMLILFAYVRLRASKIGTTTMA